MVCFSTSLLLTVLMVLNLTQMSSAQDDFSVLEAVMENIIFKRS